MLKAIVQSAVGKVGYYLRSSNHFGDLFWPDLSWVLKQQGIHDPMVFDVGAHFGETLRGIHGQFPGATIHCFEPDPNSFKVLGVAATGVPNASLWPLALGSEPGEAEFHCYSESMTNSLLKASEEARQGELADLVGNETTIRVPVATLDAFCKEQGIGAIDLLKTDCQGFDLRVLQGARGMLESGKIRVVSCEMIFDDEYEGQGSHHEIFKLMDECGFRLVGLYNMARNEARECSFCDGIFKLKRNR
jgi:FkbM family methyltransferase